MLVAEFPSVLFTVFTPTYNRADTLERVYLSLKAQTCRDFEWLIVDDGSTDGTKQYLLRVQQEAQFLVRYIYQHNQGKHTAFNRGVEEAHGQLFLTLDSDDACTPNALERLRWHWFSIPELARAKFSAVTALCSDERGRVVGDEFPTPVLDSDPLEVRYRYKVRGEKWGFQRTETLRAHPFPTEAGLRYVPEGLVWDEIGRKYKTRYVNEVLRVYYTGKAGRADQLSSKRAALRRDFQPGMVMSNRATLNLDARWFWWAPIELLRVAVHYSRFSLHLRRGLLQQFRELRTLSARLLLFAALPLAWLAYGRDKLQG